MTKEEFKAYRLRYNRTQEQWGKLIGLCRVQVSKIESGKAPIMRPLAQSVLYIVGLEEPQKTLNDTKEDAGK